MSADLKNLLMATHRGDEPAARVLWNTQGPRLLHYARAIVACGAAAEDVVQTVFCRMLQVPRRDLDRVLDPASWLAQLVRREAINHLRTSRREIARREAVGGMGRLRLTRAAGPESPVADAELQAAIERLPRRLREVVVLKHVAGLTFDQIAAATGLNRNTAAARYRSAMDAIRASLAPPALGAPKMTDRAYAQEVGHAG